MILKNETKRRDLGKSYQNMYMITHDASCQ